MKRQETRRCKTCKFAKAIKFFEDGDDICNKCKIRPGYVGKARSVYDIFLTDNLWRYAI